MSADRYANLVRLHGPTYRSSGGLLLAAVQRGEHVAPSMVPLSLGGGLVVQVSADALAAPLPESTDPIRLPVSYDDTVAVCRILDCLPPTAAVSDAVWRAAAVHVQPRGLVMTADDATKMDTVEWTLRHAAAIETSLRAQGNTSAALRSSGTLIADVGKDWVIDNGLAELGAVNYGWREASGRPLQSLGHQHIPSHHDYSQVLRVVSRAATLGGAPVDLLDVLERGGIARRWLDVYR